jgi:Ca2+/Na+ antiporter
MALGSSAPEIMLSVFGIMGTNYYAEELGPSTIVGSAAFNLLMIIAYCIIGIPPADGDTETGIRKIR